MKNFFSVNKTDNTDNTDYDVNPYLARRVSDEVKQKLDSAFDVLEEDMVPPPPSEEYTEMKKKEGIYWLVCLICFLTGVILFLLGSELNWFDPAYLLLIPVGILLVAALVLCISAKSTKNKREALDHAHRKVDFDEATQRLEAASAEAADELGIPDHATAADILPYHYTVKDGKEVLYGKKGRFDNLTLSFFLCGDGLHVATACELFVIPYLFWFPFMIFAYVYAFFTDAGAFRRMMRFTVLTYGGGLLMFILFPTCQNLRPQVFPRENFLTAVMAWFYTCDTSTNVCPSLHVCGSLAAAFGLLDTRRFSTPGWRRAIWATALTICASTVFVKQHSILDTVCGFLFSGYAWLLVYGLGQERQRMAKFQNS